MHRNMPGCKSENKDQRHFRDVAFGGTIESFEKWLVLIHLFDFLFPLESRLQHGRRNMNEQWNKKEIDKGEKVMTRNIQMYCCLYS